jgi:hypothetical protein
MGRVDWIWFFTQTYPERFQIPSCQIKNCNIFGNSLQDHTESHCCNFQAIGVVFERSISWWFEHKLQQLPLKCWWHLIYSTFEPSLVLATNRVRFACYSHCWFPGEVRSVCLQISWYCNKHSWRLSRSTRNMHTNCNQHFAHNVQIPRNPVASEVLPVWAPNDQPPLALHFLLNPLGLVPHFLICT